MTDKQKKAHVVTTSAVVVCILIVAFILLKVATNWIRPYETFAIVRFRIQDGGMDDQKVAEEVSMIRRIADRFESLKELSVLEESRSSAVVFLRIEVSAADPEEVRDICNQIAKEYRSFSEDGTNRTILHQAIRPPDRQRWPTGIFSK